VRAEAALLRCQHSAVVEGVDQRVQPRPPPDRGLPTSTTQLNLSRSCHSKYTLINP
jgi:hypothetical protein